MSLKITHITAVFFIDSVVKFIALETGLDVVITQHVLRQVVRLFFSSWINRGCPSEVVRSSKQYWFTVESFKPKGEFTQLIRWLRGLLKLVAGLACRRLVFCVGARDKKWVKEFYSNRAARVDFPGSPDWLLKRSEALRYRLEGFLTSVDIAVEDARAVATVLPEELLEGSLFRIRLFQKLLPISSKNQICSEDLIENPTSACLVAVALEKKWEFIYKEHTVPMFVFRGHFSWDYLKVASRVILTEDYTPYICEQELREKSLYSRKNRTCRFRYAPTGKLLVCLPFIPAATSWLSCEDWIEEAKIRESDLGKIWELIEMCSKHEEVFVKHHPMTSRGVPIESFPAETYDGSAVKGVVFINWSQGLFECLDAGVPARIVFLRPMNSLTDTGKQYFKALEEKGLISWNLKS